MRRPGVVLLLLVACQSAPPPKTEQDIIYSAKEKVFPALVFIKPIREEFRSGEKQKQQVFGSGVIYDAEGHVVTNHHVIDQATEIKCVLSNKDEVRADIVGFDPDTDLAVIKLRLAERQSKTPLPVPKFANFHKITEGDLVMAMGAPQGLERSVSRGIISSTERTFEFAPYNLLLQTDAAINPGNSGGPLVNERGEVVGINALMATRSENIGFAIPCDITVEVADELIADKKRKGETGPGQVTRAWFGMELQALKDFTKSAYINATRGVLVASVDPASPSHQCGIRAGDILLSCNGKDLNGIYETDLPNIRRFLGKQKIDVPSTFALLRDGTPLSIPVVPTVRGKSKGGDYECKKWGMTVKEITKHSEPFFAFHKEKGVYIQGVKPYVGAGASGLSAFDIILKIGDFNIDSLDAVQKAYDKYASLEKGKRKIMVKVLRSGIPRTVALDFEKDPDSLEDE
jgi:serine protease Do